MSQYQHRFWLAPAMLAVACACGCRTLGEVKPDNAASPVTEAEAIRIVYRTKTDRLNLAGGALPACSMATLFIQVPHPEHHANAARVRLCVAPLAMDADVSPDDLKNVTAHATETWQDDIPLWQIQSIVDQLKAANFFRRSKIFNADAYLWVDAGANQLGKPYREVPELDAMIVRLNQPNPPATPPSQGRELARLPAVQER